jgi:hypothetical protein
MNERSQSTGIDRRELFGAAAGLAVAAAWPAAAAGAA